MTLWVKICGITSVEDGLMTAQAGASAIGLNFASASKRFVEPERAQQIVAGLRQAGYVDLEIVGVFVDMPIEQVRSVVAQVGLDAVQLHGHETAAQLQGLLDAGLSAFRAARIGSSADVAEASGYPGSRILVDAKVEGAMGGTGHQFDWGLIQQLVSERQLVLAGGLRPDNVAEAVREVRPYGIDTASGVESEPGKKDPEKVRAFIENARSA